MQDTTRKGKIASLSCRFTFTEILSLFQKKKRKKTGLNLCYKAKLFLTFPLFVIYAEQDAEVCFNVIYRKFFKSHNSDSFQLFCHTVIV